MTSRFADFRRKEIISVKSGLKIGYVDDLVFDTATASVESVVVYGRPRLFGLLGRTADLLIRWSDIEVVGEDTILVRSDGVEEPRPDRRSGLFDRLFG